jgi:hypothetical protein
VATGSLFNAAPTMFGRGQLDTQEGGQGGGLIGFGDPTGDARLNRGPLLRMASALIDFARGTINRFQRLRSYDISCSRFAPIIRSISVLESWPSCGTMNVCSKVP